jgi:hypothetical protein
VNESVERCEREIHALAKELGLRPGYPSTDAEYAWLEKKSRKLHLTLQQRRGHIEIERSYR